MSAALKKLSDQDKTAEFEVPESILKQGATAIKAEHAEISLELETLQHETERKEDEPTVVFNLRQEQMAKKIEELENRKSAFERELKDVLEKQNSKIQADIKKVAHLLVSDNKKNPPLEKINANLAALNKTQGEWNEDIFLIKRHYNKSQLLMGELKEHVATELERLEKDLEKFKGIEKRALQKYQQAEADYQEMSGELKVFRDQIQSELSKVRQSFPISRICQLEEKQNELDHELSGLRNHVKHEITKFSQAEDLNEVKIEFGNLDREFHHFKDSITHDLQAVRSEFPHSDIHALHRQFREMNEELGSLKNLLHYELTQIQENPTLAQVRDLEENTQKLNQELALLKEMYSSQQKEMSKPSSDPHLKHLEMQHREVDSVLANFMEQMNDEMKKIHQKLDQTSRNSALPEKVQSDSHHQLMQKKRLFKQHLEKLLSEGQKPEVFELLDDLFMSLRSK